MDKVFQEWLSFAETDLGVARHLYESYHPKPLRLSAITASNLLKKRSKL